MEVKLDLYSSEMNIFVKPDDKMCKRGDTIWGQYKRLLFHWILKTNDSVGADYK